MKSEYVGLVGLCLALVATTATAQNTFPTSGNVGIGLTNPKVPLEVNGGTLVDTTVGGGNGLTWAMQPGHNGIMPSLRSFSAGAYSPGEIESSYFVINGETGGNVGIGTTSPQSMLDVAGVINGRNFSIPATFTGPSWAKIGTFAGGAGETIRITAYIHNGYNAHNYQDATYFISFKTSNGAGGSVDGNGFAGNGSWYAIGYNSAIPQGNIVWVANNPGTSATQYSLYNNLPIYTAGSHYSVSIDQAASWTNAGSLVGSGPGVPSNTVMVPPSEFDLPYGNVGIGTNSSAYKLEINGNVKLTSGSGASMTFQDGSVQTVAWNGVLGGGDYAESVDVIGDRAQYEPGDVLVIDAATPGSFLRSTAPYSTAVAGIYSTKPGVRGRRQGTDSSHMKDEVPMAMVGVVPTKVSAESGPIKSGDLLVTSSKPGYAMKGADRAQLAGAIVGKAMGNLESGIGVIEVLVSLQ